jgi:hypothetical protein
LVLVHPEHHRDWWEPMRRREWVPRRPVAMEVVCREKEFDVRFLQAVS